MFGVFGYPPFPSLLPLALNSTSSAETKTILTAVPDAGYKAGEKTLVHCRVGVSRSASICIAEVMRRTHLSLPRAYLFVRARRLNVIIQPNLRFMYELMKWEELEYARSLEKDQSCLDPFSDAQENREYKREMEWAWLCKEIADLNRTYTATP